jgi:hypothetical protein
MVYTYTCPAPCSRVIMVDATNDDDAINKIIGAGAINCRNTENTSCCKKIPHLSPLPENKLREIVQLCMNAENW